MEDEWAALRAEVARLRAEKARLEGLLRLSPAEASAPAAAQSGVALPGLVTIDSEPADKVALYLDIFRSRLDVYAVRWENARDGRAGWMPAVAGGWRRGRSSAQTPTLPLTRDVVASHLAGQTTIGLYPLLSGDECFWVAADFDGESAILDALAYLKAARAAAVPATLEISRSGRGAHVWVFFAAAVAASLARRLALGLLREAMSIRGRLSLSSYDRLFPAQDVLPAGGFGNLLAAPLQGECRRRGATVFVDLATMEPAEDQWRHLSSLDRMSPRELTRAVGRVGEPAVGAQVRALRRTVATAIVSPTPPVVRVRLDAAVTIAGEDLVPEMRSTLMHAASLRNPAFDERQRARRSTWDTPRYVRGYDETVTGDLVLPRGLGDLVISLVGEQGSRVDVSDTRQHGAAIAAEFTGELRTDQSAAVSDLAAHDLGVLVAPPGAGKTVMACSLIARRGVSTLVLVDRKALADQWRTRIAALLGVKAGQLGGGRARLTGVVDVATLQTLARREDIGSLCAAYGQVVVDECHHIPAAAFEHVVRQIPARWWVGLTATPYRRDGLDDIIGWQLGPERHQIDVDSGAPTLDGPVPAPLAILVRHETAYRYAGVADPRAPGGMATIYRDLVADEERLTQVVGDVREALAKGRHCLIISQWTDHVARLATALNDRNPVVFVGGMGVKATRAAMARLDPAAGPLLVVATGSYLGEGFDCPALDTLFLAAPISFHGRLVQYAGRILRPWPDKATAVVHDYVDVEVPVIARSWEKRNRGYRSLGFRAGDRDPQTMP